MADYNWEMTGPPDEVTIATDPEAVASWNNYVEQATSDFGGGYDSPFAPQVIDNPVYDDPTYWNSGKNPYQGGDGQTYYAENFLRPEEYVSMGYAAPYSREQILAAVNPENIRYGFQNTPYAGLFSQSGQSAGEYVVNPETGRFVLDQSGNPIAVPREQQKSGSFDSFMETAIPLLIAAGAIGTGAGALGLIGAGAAGGAAGTTAVGAPVLASTGEVGLLSNPLILSTLKGAGYGALTGGVTSALTGQDALRGALIGGATGGILGGGEAALFPGGIELVSNPVTNAGLLGAARGSAGGAINTLLGGGDLKTNILYGGIGGGVLGAGSEYFFPSTVATGAESSPASRQAAQDIQNSYRSQYEGIDTTTPEMLYGVNRYDPTYDIARAQTQDYFDASADPSRYWTNTEVADSVKALDQYNLTPEQIRLSLEQEGMYKDAARMASEMSGSSSEDIARKLELNFGEKIGPEGDIGIEMYKYTNTPLDEQYINQDLQEGYVSQFRNPVSQPNFFSGLGNLGTMLAMGALGKGGGGGSAAKIPQQAGGSFVPRGMVDYSGILGLLAPKTSTRSSLLG